MVRFTQNPELYTRSAEEVGNDAMNEEKATIHVEIEARIDELEAEIRAVRESAMIPENFGLTP